jgi:quinol monooxygenase YgiN
MILQIYTLPVAVELEVDFVAAAGALANSLRQCAGCLAAQIAKSSECEYLFIEHWQDDASRKAAGGSIDPKLFAALQNATAGKPEAISAEIIDC